MNPYRSPNVENSIGKRSSLTTAVRRFFYPWIRPERQRFAIVSWLLGGLVFCSLWVPYITTTYNFVTVWLPETADAIGTPSYAICIAYLFVCTSSATMICCLALRRLIVARSPWICGFAALPLPLLISTTTGALWFTSVGLTEGFAQGVGLLALISVLPMALCIGGYYGAYAGFTSIAVQLPISILTVVVLRQSQCDRTFDRPT